MLRRLTAPRVKATNAITTSMRFNALAGAGYRTGPFVNPVRRPQLTDAERENVEIDQSQWPAEFKDYDPQNPYQNFKPFIEGLSAFQLWLCGVELAFIIAMWEMVFYPSL